MNILGIAIDWIFGIVLLTAAVYSWTHSLKPTSDEQLEEIRKIPRFVRRSVIFGFFVLLFLTHMYVTFIGLAACMGVIDYKTNEEDFR